MSLTDIARGRRSVRDRKTTRATNGTGSKGLTARTWVHSSYAAAMRIAGWPAERRRVRDGGDRIRSESLDGARWRSARNNRDIGRIAPWEKALRAIGSRRSPLKCTGIRVASPRHIHIGGLLSAGLPPALTSEIHRDPSRFTADMSTLKSALRQFEIHRSASYLATEIAVSKVAPRWVFPPLTVEIHSDASRFAADISTSRIAPRWITRQRSGFGFTGARF